MIIFDKNNPPKFEDMINQVICGDCKEVMKHIPSGAVDLIVTDPPYQARFAKGGGSFGDREYFKNVKDGVGSSLNFEIKQYLPEIKRICKDEFSGYFWTSQRLIYDYLCFCKENDLSFDILVWQKTNPIPTKNNKYLPELEYVVYARGKNAFWSNDEKYEFYKKVYTTPVQKTGINHPTIKPLKTIIPSICISSKEDDIIIDPFLGSGTTAMACKQTGRKFIGIEKEKKYCEIAERRLAQEYLF